MAKVKLFLDKILNEQNSSRYRLSKRTGMSESQLSKICRANRLDFDTILTLCISLGCQPGDLLKIVDEEGEELGPADIADLPAPMRKVVYSSVS